MDYETSNKIVVEILKLSNEESKVYDFAEISKFSESLPKEITINKFVNSIPGIDEKLEELLDSLSEYYNSQTIFTNLGVIFGKLVTNTNFDYYKEMQNEQI
jgi:hypothetical protein